MAFEEYPTRDINKYMREYMREYRRKKNIVERFGSRNTVGTLIGVASHLALRDDFKIELFHNQHDNVVGLWIGVVEPQRKLGQLGVLKSMLAKRALRPWQPNIDGDRYKKKVPLKGANK